MTIGNERYILVRKARGREMVLSPVYFPEHLDDFAELAAGNGPARIARVLKLVAQNQGWPLSVIEKRKRIGQESVSPEEIAILKRLAGDNLTAAQSIDTKHAGNNFFLFGPRPGFARLAPTRKQLLEKAYAILAAIRQGQLLAKQYRILYPRALLTALRDRGYVGANSEALEQYRQLMVVHHVGRLVPVGSTKWKFELIKSNKENVDAVNLALQLLSAGEPGPSTDEELVLALKQGDTYVETLVSRQRLVEQQPVELDPEDEQALNDLLIMGPA